MSVFDRFPVEDITHKPKRSQSENLKAAGSEEVLTVSVKKEDTSLKSRYTLESAIKFYRNEKPDDIYLKILYKQTAEWLEEFRVKRNAKVIRVEE